MANIALYIARTGLDVAQQNMANIAHNAANVNTDAFKANLMHTTDLSYSQIKQAGIQQSQDTFGSPSGIQVGNGAKVNGTSRVMTDGPLEKTNNPLDIAIRGSGYFAVTLPNGGTGYTRAGRFQVTKTGQVTTIEGYALDDDLVIDYARYNATPKDLTINKDGTVTINDNTTVPPTVVQLETITLWEFPNDQGLQEVGGGIYLETDASGDALQMQLGQNNYMESKAIEKSNVNHVQVLTDLIEANHLSDLNGKVITAINDMEKSISNMYK